ncbi:MAG: hypothetical protein K0R69_3420 [Clostridia bacterium]|jgi:YesN/AraC family two-component response regulator|nr:hypothetical protein [Clostridia bacterium]
MNLDFNDMIPDLHYYIHRKCTPSWKIEPTITTFNDITYVIKGKAEYTIGNQTYIAKKGDLIYVPKNTYRTAINIPEDLMECYSANFFLHDQMGQDISLPLPIISHIGILPKLVSSFHEMHGEWLNRNFGYMLKVRSILCLILHQILNVLLNENHLIQEDPRIKNSIHYMSTHYIEAITITTMAELFHLHPVYYGNLFQRAMGMTFKQYLISLRLSYAENMLKSGEYSVSETAVQCGFSDIYYFSKVFKAKKGISPSELFPPEKKQQTDEILLLSKGEIK